MTKEQYQQIAKHIDDIIKPHGKLGESSYHRSDKTMMYAVFVNNEITSIRMVLTDTTVVLHYYLHHTMTFHTMAFQLSDPTCFQQLKAIILQLLQLFKILQF